MCVCVCVWGGGGGGGGRLLTPFFHLYRLPREEDAKSCRSKIIIILSTITKSFSLNFLLFAIYVHNIYVLQACISFVVLLFWRMLLS